MKIYHRFIAFFLSGLLYFCVSIPSHAAAIFEFDLMFSSGPVSGNTYTGLFSVDSFEGTGLEGYAPEGTSLPISGTLLSLAVTIEGVEFNMEQDVEFPDAPTVGFFDGNLVVLGATLLIDDQALLRIVYVASAEEPINGVALVISEISDDPSFGTLSIPRSVGIPEPELITLLSLGLPVLGIRKRRKEA